MRGLAYELFYYGYIFFLIKILNIMGNLKLILFLCLLRSVTVSFGQSYELIQKANSDYDMLSGVFIEACGSFLDNANHHANTVKIHDFLDSQMSSIKTFQSNCYDFNLMDLYGDCEHLYKYVSGMETFLSWIMGHGGECDEEQWSLIEETLKGFNWTSNVLYMNTPFALFTEYSSPDGFKILVVKNVLPDDNSYNAIIPSTDNYIEINYTYSNGAGGMRVVKPGCTDIIQFKDDENQIYYKLSSAVAKRHKR